MTDAVLSDRQTRVRLGLHASVCSAARLTIEDGALIGHNVVIATLNHPLDPAHRADAVPAPVVIGKGVLSSGVCSAGD